MQWKVRNYYLPLESLVPGGRRHSEVHGRGVSFRVQFGYRTNTCRRSHERSWTSVCNGNWAPGYFSPFAAEEKVVPAPGLEGVERLDATPFVHVAGLTFDWLGWADEGERAWL